MNTLGNGIVIIGWGSLIWDSRDLNLRDGEWYKDGPRLPVEFARVSEDGRLTLVIVPNSGVPLQQTLWAYSACNTLEKAKKDLVKREGTYNCVSVINVNEGRAVASDSITKTIFDWCKEKDLDGAVWTNLKPKNQNNGESVMTPNEAISYLHGLEHDILDEARNYIKNAPKQIQTPIRKKVCIEFGWCNGKD